MTLRKKGYREAIGLRGEVGSEGLDGNKSNVKSTQSALLNILEDFDEEKIRLENTQRALLNILEDFDIEKTKVAEANVMLQTKSEEVNRSNEELQRARDTLEIRVVERTAELQRSNEQLKVEMEERKRVAEALKQRSLDLESAIRDLEVSNKELESFSYSVSHDLRSPLRSMDGFSLALMEDYGDRLDAQAREYLEFIRSSSQLMAHLIDDLLNLARITRQEIMYEQVDISELATEVVDELVKVNPERSVEFVIAPELEAYGDRRLLKLVLENLLGNALKFTGKRSEARIEFGVAESDDRRPYFVKDNGIGFDMAYVDKLFRPFQRLHRAEDFSGTGIGLASVLRIINRLGGKVWGEGAVGKGATFYFILGTTNAEEKKGELWKRK